MKIHKTGYPDAGGKIYDLVIHWKVTEYCNFSCPGCSGQAVKTGPDYLPERINLPALRKFLKKLHKTAKLVFTGGEPFLIENMVEVCAEVTQKHYITCITNLTSPKIADFAAAVNPERVVLVKASTHIQQLEKNNLLLTYINNFNLLQKRNFKLLAEEVAYPALAPKADMYRSLFADQGIALNFQAYRGVWKNKKYPEAYTAEELAAFKFEELSAGKTAMHHRKNRLCNAGYNAIVACNGGTIYPCFFLQKPLGNIYKHVKLHKKLIRCPFDYCDCPVAVFDPQLFTRACTETAEPAGSEGCFPSCANYTADAGKL